MRVLFYDKDQASGGPSILRDVLERVSSLDSANWTVAECCTNCWERIWLGKSTESCEKGCGAANVFRENDQDSEKAVLWLHIKKPWPDALDQQFAGQNHGPQIRAIVVTSMREERHVYEFPPALVNGRIICVSLGRAGVALLNPKKGDPGIAQLWEATTTLENALDHAELCASTENKLDAFLEPGYWSNEESAALFQIRLPPPVRLIATWWAHRTDSGLSELVALRNGLWHDDGLVALGRRPELGTSLREARLAERHRSIFLPLDLQSRWSTAKHQGKAPNLEQRKIDVRSWISENKIELVQLLGEHYTKTKEKFKQCLLNAARSWHQ